MDLIGRSQAGEEGAFTDLFEKHKNLVYKTAYLMLGSTQEAEDVLQEVFLRVHRSLDTFQPSRGSFTTWLYRVTVNWCISRKRRRRPSQVRLDTVPASTLVAGGLSLESTLVQQDEVWRAIHRLTEKQRGVVVLRYYWELSYAEIAEVLDVPLGTVQSRLNLALRTMRTLLERDTGPAGLGAPMGRQEVIP